MDWKEIVVNILYWLVIIIIFLGAILVIFQLVTNMGEIYRFNNPSVFEICVERYHMDIFITGKGYYSCLNQTHKLYYNRNTHIVTILNRGYGV